MKKIINGKMYNTETALKIHNYYNGLGSSDFKNLDETLYKTKNGSYFLAGEGGPMTKYAYNNGNTSCGGWDIIPLTEAEALSWIENNEGDTETISKYFQITEA